MNRPVYIYTAKNPEKKSVLFSKMRIPPPQNEDPFLSNRRIIRRFEKKNPHSEEKKSSSSRKGQISSHYFSQYTFSIVIFYTIYNNLYLTSFTTSFTLSATFTSLRECKSYWKVWRKWTKQTDNNLEKKKDIFFLMFSKWEYFCQNERKISPFWQKIFSFRFWEHLEINCLFVFFSWFLSVHFQQ